jgi:hypothetical protein
MVAEISRNVLQELEYAISFDIVSPVTIPCTSGSTAAITTLGAHVG